MATFKDRVPYSVIIDRPKLQLPGGARMAVWTIVNARDSVRQWKVRLNAVQLRRRQPELISHVMSSLNRSIIIGENAEQKTNESCP